MPGSEAPASDCQWLTVMGRSDEALVDHLRHTQEYVHIGAWGNPPNRTRFFIRVTNQPAPAARGARGSFLEIRLASNADKADVKTGIYQGSCSQRVCGRFACSFCCTTHCRSETNLKLKVNRVRPVYSMMNRRTGL